MSIESPCIRNCCLDDNDLCYGCFRHIEEIKQWTLVDDEQKKAILTRAKVRKQKHLETVSHLGLPLN